MNKQVLDETILRCSLNVLSRGTVETTDFTLEEVVAIMESFIKDVRDEIETQKENYF